MQCRHPWQHQRNTQETASLEVNSLLAGLVLSALALWGVLQDVCCQLVAHIHLGGKSAGLAKELDVLSLVDVDNGLGVSAGVALDKALDETLEQVSQLGSLVRTVDNGDASLVVELGLSAELAAEEFGRVCKKNRVYLISKFYKLQRRYKAKRREKT
jgi:hypothetical protein